MPKSKRNHLVSLTQVKKKGRDGKTKLIELVRKSCDDFTHVYVIGVSNFRNNKMQKVREDWKPSRFFFGKNSVMGLALGHTQESEYKENIHQVSKRLHHGTGLLFTDKEPDHVLKWFESYESDDYSRMGDSAVETIKLDAGPLKQFAHSIEPHLRSLGLPTSLDRGVVTLLQDFTLCQAGQSLTSEQAKLLKLFEVKQASIKFTVECVWSFVRGEAKFQQLSSQEKLRTKSSKTKYSPAILDSSAGDEPTSDDGIDMSSEHEEDNSKPVVVSPEKIKESPKKEEKVTEKVDANPEEMEVDDAVTESPKKSPVVPAKDDVPPSSSRKPRKKPTVSETPLRRSARNAGK